MPPRTRDPEMVSPDKWEDENWTRYYIIHALVAVIAPFQWCLCFALFSGLSTYRYWDKDFKIGVALGILVLGPYVLMPWVVSHIQYPCSVLMHHGWSLVEWTWQRAVQFWMKPSWIEFFMYLALKMVFVPFILPERVRPTLERMLRATRKPFAFECLLDNRMLALEKKHETKVDMLEGRIEFLQNRLAACHASAQTHSKELAEKDSRITMLEARLETLEEENRNHDTHTRQLVQSFNASKAELNDRIFLQSLEIEQRKADTQEHSERARQVDLQLNAFTCTLRAVENVQHKLLSNMEPREIGPAMAVLESIINDQKKVMKDLEQQIKTLEGNHKRDAQRIRQLQAELAQLAQAKTEKSRKEEVFLMRFDKQVLIKLVRHPVFIEHIKNYMRLDVSQMHLFEWMIPAVETNVLDACITEAFGEGRDLVTTMTVIHLGKFSTVSTTTINAVRRALHPDKCNTIRPFVLTLRTRMFNKFQEEAKRIMDAM
jgi:prefoldin subunit 5